MKIFRRGQASIEFALILPIFAMLLFALVYVGFLFIDVVTLDSAAAAAARSAAMNKKNLNLSPGEKPEPSDAVREKIQNTTLFLYWYEMDEASPKIKKEEEVTEKVLEDDSTKKLVRTDIFFTGMVQVKLTGKAAENKILKMFLPEKYTVRKVAHTYKEEIKDISAGGD